MRIKYLWLKLIFLLWMRPLDASIYLIPEPYQNLPRWEHSSFSAPMLTALKASCQRNLNLFSYYFQNKPDVRGQLAWWISCEQVLSLPEQADSAQIKNTLEGSFQAYLVTHNFSSYGLFTGYYLPEHYGSLRKSHYFSVPLYGMPTQTSNIPTREQISQMHSIPGIPILAWIHSDVDRYFMQVQGSGIIILASGQGLLLGYAGQNGYPYYPIGRFLKDTGAIAPERMSAENLENWLEHHPKLAQHVMNIDASFVFFRVLPTAAPLGAEKIPLTSGHSLAVNPDYIPLGTPLWLSTYYPAVNATGVIVPGAPLHRFMVAQDTGGAINGPIRGDVYWGSGKEARFLASHMQSMGQYWLLLPKGLNVAQLSQMMQTTEQARH